MIKGRIHSIESMGLVDGPGIRTVVFFQGCRLRCIYCHNPDTWNINDGTEISPKELVNKLIKYKTYFDKSGGGVTFSGGDPLLQPDFLLECLKLCKEYNIHTAIDTSGFGTGNYDIILKYVDLVILDIKHTNNSGYNYITGKNMEGLDEFITTLEKSNTVTWIRHVVIPGITDSKEHIINLANIINKRKINVEKIELLPYHTLGVNKYKNLNIKYKLEGTAPMNKEVTLKLQNFLKKNIQIK